MSRQTRMYDLLRPAVQAGVSIGSGKSYEISDITALPATFTADFTSAACVTTEAHVGPEKMLTNAERVGIQIIVSAKGAGFSGLVAKVQESNVGGSEAKVWSDVPSATVTLTDVGSGMVAIGNTGLKLSRFYRMHLTASGGTCTAYAVAFGQG